MGNALPKNKIRIPDWLRSIQWGICHGPIDTLNKLWVKDEQVLCGQYSGRQDIPINLPELFGGDDKEGGVVGTIELYPGTDDQLASPMLASKVGRVPENHPGYRGLAHIFMRGRGSEGFRWGSNNPYMPSVRLSVTRNPTTLSPTHARIFPVIGFNPETSEVQLTDGESALLVGTPFEYAILPELSGQYPAGAVRTRWDEWVNSGPGWREALTPTSVTTVPGEPQNTASMVRYWNLLDLFTPEQLLLGTAEVEFTITVLRPNGAAAANNDQVSLWVNTHVDVNGEPDPNTRNSRPLAPLASPGFSFFGNGVATQTGRLTISSRENGWLRVEVAALDLECFRFENITVRGNEAEYIYCDPDNYGLRSLPNANPAHIVHEAMTNPEWGKGEDPTRIDTASFQAAAATFFAEHLGLAFAWMRQGTVEDFVQQVLDHAQAMLFIHPRTGLWTLKPLRADYDVAAVLAGRRLDESNCVAKKRKRRAWGETVNEIIVKYTDPATEEDATVTAHNLANIAVQGGVISETRNYPGIRDAWVAQRVAERDVTEAGHPIYSAEVECDRSFWDLVPGDVVAYSYPEDGIAGMVVRVMEVEYGSPTDRTMKLKIAEDIFALEQSAFGPVQGSEWESERAFPQPLDAQMAMAAPLPMILASGVPLTEVDAAFPAVGVMLLGDPVDDLTVDIQVLGPVTLADGSTTTDVLTTVSPVRVVLLESEMPAEASSTLPGLLVAGLSLGAAERGDLLLLGDSEANHEIVMLGAYNSLTDTWEVLRGLYDTVPVAWPIGTRLWLLPDALGQVDPTERAAGEVVPYTLLPGTSEGRLNPLLATPFNYTATQRPHQPFRPANVQIENFGFGVASWPTGVTYPVNVTWANRNRTTEDQVALRWTQPNVTPEAGQTTVLRVLDDQGALAGEIAGLAGTSYGMAEADFFGVSRGFIEFVSERAGIRSRPGARREFDRASGYGVGYGISYGP